MNALLRLVFIFVFTAASQAAVAPSADVRTIEAEISRLDATRVEALLKGDLKTLEQLYSDELVYVHSGGRVDSKQQYLTLLAAGNLIYVSQRYDPPARVRVVGRDTAVVTGQVTIETKNKSGQVTKRVLTTTTVYVRSQAGWQVVSYQGTPVQP